MESKLTGEEEDEINVPMALSVFRDGTGEDEWVSVSNSNKKSNITLVGVNRRLNNFIVTVTSVSRSIQ